MEESLNLKLSMFEGPFDLLLTLLEKNKIEITDIQISVIADQYVDFLFGADVFNMDVASEFLVMAMTRSTSNQKAFAPATERGDGDHGRRAGGPSGAL